MFQVIPRERAFYDLLERDAAGVAASARELLSMVASFPDGALGAARIAELEQEGDDLTHEILSLLNRTFVTPIDRHDIHALASSLDDVLDLVDNVAALLILHGVTEPLPQFRQQVEILVVATEAVESAVHSLRAPHNLGRPWEAIMRAERDGDHVYRRGVASLYSGDFKAMDVLRWKDLLRRMETAIDRCEDIANTVESIALKHA